MRIIAIEYVGLVFVLVGFALLLVGAPKLVVEGFTFFGNGVTWGACVAYLVTRGS